MPKIVPIKKSYYEWMKRPSLNLGCWQITYWWMGYISNSGGSFDSGGNRLQGGRPPRGGGSSPTRGGYNGILRSGGSNP